MSAACRAVSELSMTSQDEINGDRPDPFRDSINCAA